MRRLTVLLLVGALALGAACGGSGGSDKRAFCKKAESIDSQFTALEAGFTSSKPPTHAVFEKAARSIDGLVKDAPKEIKTDLAAVAAGVHKIADALVGVDLADPKALDDPVVNARISKALAPVNGKLQAASDRVNAYLTKACGFDIGGSSTSTTQG